jgi:hypothetical protein
VYKIVHQTEKFANGDFCANTRSSVVTFDKFDIFCIFVAELLFHDPDFGFTTTP